MGVATTLPNFQAPALDLDPVRPRAMAFDFGAELDRYWYNDNPYLTHFMNALSAVFPEGERFFIETVRHYMDRIDDPAMLQEIRGFIGQEAHHGRQHEAFNGLVEDQGYPMGAIGRVTRDRLAMTREFLTPERRLAITIALEHFTAIMAHQVLEDPDLIAGAPKAVRDLIFWHALEETEHKAVAFDVYQQVCGDLKLRRSVMVRVTIFFLLRTFTIQVKLLRQDGMPIRPLKMLEAINYMVGKPGLFRRLASDYLDFYKADFHPWKHDNRYLLRGWKRSFFKDEAV